MKPYYVSYSFYYNDELLSQRHVTRLLDEPREEEFSGTDFEGLWDLTYQWSALIPLNMWEFKKGKRFLQHYDAIISRITEKNCKPWRFVISSEEAQISMNELMEFDTEDVIKYLKERGITTCPLTLK